MTNHFILYWLIHYRFCIIKLLLDLRVVLFLLLWKEISVFSSFYLNTWFELIISLFTTPKTSLFIILNVYHLVKISWSECLYMRWIILARVDLMYKDWVSNILSSHFIIYWIVPYHIQMINIWLYSWIELILYI